MRRMTKHELKRLINEELKGVIKMNYAIFEAVDRAVENYFSLEKLIEEVNTRREHTETGLRISIEILATQKNLNLIMSDILRELKLIRATAS